MTVRRGPGRLSVSPVRTRATGLLLASWAALVGVIAALALLHVLGFVAAVALFGSVEWFAFHD